MIQDSSEQTDQLYKCQCKAGYTGVNCDVEIKCENGKRVTQLT